jgi:methionine-rich copper-binding protein CopC
MKYNYSISLFIKLLSIIGLAFMMNYVAFGKNVSPFLYHNQIPSTNATIEDNNPSFKVYPNPSDGKNFQIVFSNVPLEKMEVIIYNSIGNMVHRKSFDNETGEGTIVVSPEKQLKPGLYFVVINLNRQLYTQRLLVK